MTISSTTRIAGPFVGTGSASVFPFTFKVFAASNLNVIRLDSSTGVETTLVLTTDYTVTLNGNQNTNPGGSVTLVAGALASGFTLTITSDIANLQPTDLTNQGGFYPEVITDSLDRATIQIQQMADDLTRSIKTPISDGLALNMELPTAAQRANSFLAFDASGEPTTVTAGSSGAPATITRQVFSGTGSQTVFTLASDPGALGNSAQVYIGGVYQQRSTYTIAGTTLTFSAPPVAGTDNIEFVNFLTSNIGATSADLVTYTPAGSGAVARSAASKFGDTVSVKDFGAVGNGVADDTTAIQAAIDYATSIGGQTVACGGLTYKTTGPIIVKDDVKLDLQGGKILSVLSGSNDYGVRLRNRSEVCNGEIEVQSSGSPGSQAGIHAPLVIGPFYGDGGTVASPSVDEGVASWTARNLKLWTNRDGKVCIQVTGGANNGLIENIEAPSSSTLAGVVHLDWGFVGTINSANVTASRTNFDAGTAYTTHPNNVLIRNIKAGALTRTKSGVDTGSHLVRLSGVYNISVANVVATQCTYAAVRVTAGDLGFEFALAAVKPMGMRGIRWNGVSVQNTTDSWLVYCDSYADNVAAAVGGGYLPLIDPLMETDMVVDQVTGKGSGGASVTPGLYVIQIRGAKFTNINATGYSYGCLVDELVYNVKIHGTFYANRGHGIYIHHGTKKPEDVEILPQTYCYSNGQDSGFANPAGICVEGSIRCRIDGALLGNRTAANEGTQERGILLSTVTLPIDVEVENCHVFSVEAGGTAYALLGSTNYGYLKLFRNNTVESAVTNKIAGLNIIPINRFLGSDGVERAHYTAQRASLTLDITPTTGTWATGDLIFYSDPSSGNTGTRCETAGAPGTWAQF